jgi:cytochrome P450
MAATNDTARAVLDDLDVTRPGFFLRPDYYDLLAWLRADSPVHRVADGSLLVSRYDDIREISRQPDLFSSRHGALVNDPVRGHEPDDETASILHLDPPRHTAYRQLLNRRFTPRAVGRLEPTIRGLTRSVLDGLPGREPVDFVAEIASPIPVMVIAELLGIADGDRGDFRRWSDAVITISDFPTEESMRLGAELFEFLDDHVARRLASPGEQDDDLLGLLTRADVDGRPLTRDQVRLFCLSLLVAGNETTRSLLAGGAQVLAEHPEQRARLAADPECTPNAVEECVRWVTPIQAFCRTAMADTEVAGVPVPAGSYLVLLYASGNRDERAFGATAGRFDAARAATPAHVAFGFGEHLCLGSALARLEGRIVLEELLARFPRYELAGEPILAPSTLTRSIERMPVVLAPSTS